MTESKKPKPTPIDTGWHPPTWRQVIAWAVTAASWVLTYGAQYTSILPADTRAHLPWWLFPAVTLVAMLVLAVTRSPGAPSQQQLGEAVARLVEQRTSMPPTTPAREARAGLRTLRGEDDVDQDAPTNPGAPS